MSIALDIVAETLPEGICAVINSEQDRLNIYADNLRANFPGDITGIAIGTTPPSDLTKAWLQLNNNLYPVRLYTFANGHWQSMHPQVPGTIIIWDNALPDFTLFDGGDAGAPGLSSGPMWEEVTQLRARFPVGVGTLPSTTALDVTDTGGNETVNQSLTPHIHVDGKFKGASGDTSNDPEFLFSALAGASLTGLVRRINPQGGGVQPDEDISNCLGPYMITTQPLQADGSLVPPSTLNIMPPYYTVYYLRRTARQFYKV